MLHTQGWFALAALLAPSAGPTADRPRDPAPAAAPLPTGARARLGTGRLWHGPDLTEIAFTADGKGLLSAADDGVVRLWDTASGTEARVFRGHSGPVRSLAFSPDGRTLATASDDRSVRLWHVATGAAVKQWEQTAECTCVRFSSDGRTLAVALTGEKAPVVLWDLASDREERRVELEGGDAQVRIVRFRRVFNEIQAVRQGFTLGFSPDGRYLLASRGTNHILLERATGKKIRRYEVPERGECGHPRFAPDGKSWAVAGQSGIVHRLETESIEELPQLPKAEAQAVAVAFTPDGKTLAAAGASGGVTVWDLAASRLHRQFSADPTGLKALAFSPDGKTLATGDVGGVLRLWDVASGKERFDAGDRPVFSSVAISPDGRSVFTADPKTVRCWSAVTGRETGHISYAAGDPSGVVLSPGGRFLATYENREPFRILDAQTNKETCQIPCQGQPWEPLFTPDGSRFAVACREESGVARLFDSSSGKEIRSFRRSEGTGGPLAFTPEGRLLVTGEGDRYLTVWETASGKLRRRLRLPLAGGGDTPRGYAFAPDSRTLAVAQADTVALVDFETGAVVRRLEGHAEVVHCLAFAPDGATLATGGADHTVRLWDVRTGRPAAILGGHRAPVRQLRFFADGKTLLSAGDDRAALLWDVPEVLRRGVPRVEAGSANAEFLWAGLGDADARVADRAICDLSGRPEAAVKLLRARLRPVSPLPPGWVGNLVAGLDSPEFATREESGRKVGELRERAIPPLRGALVGVPVSPELRRRATVLLAAIEAAPTDGEELRALRGVEVLERVGTGEAKELLRLIAGGEPTAVLTQEAAHSLDRMTQARTLTSRRPVSSATARRAEPPSEGRGGAAPREQTGSSR